MTLMDLIPGLAVLATLAVACHECERSGCATWEAFIAAIAGLAGAVVAGRLVAWACALSAGLQTGLLHEDFSAIGAFGGAAAAAVLVLKARGARPLAIADAAAPAIALGYAIMRLGCFFEGHCFGIPAYVSWAVTYPPGTDAFAAQVSAGLIDPTAGHSLPVHPTQLYHAAVGLLAFVVLIRIRRAGTGTRVALALIGYGVTRFLIEFVRADAVPIVGPLDLNQLLCLGMMGAGMAVWWRPAAAVAWLREQVT